ncbi:MAG: CotH kinase family protein [Muribaculaceae bacterium]|nr:CotH kinase family protein [Muribaculaceae bacterium]
MKRVGIGLMIALVCTVAAVVFNMCTGDDDIVINEVMASNKTGLLAADGKQHDWIEIHNNTAHSIGLKGYKLEKDSGKVSWEFPDVKIEADGYLLVYATKDNLKDQLHCDFKLSAKGDSVQLVSPYGSVLSTAVYNKLKDDQSLKRTDGGNYKKTYKVTPGMKNDDDEYELYLGMLEKQVSGPLRIWEYMSKNHDLLKVEGKPYHWVEIKNVSNQPVDLASYSLTNDMDEPAKLALPAQRLAPGQVTVVVDKEKKLKGQSVVLTDGKKFLDGVCGGETYCGVSIGRKQGGNRFLFFGTPTPGAENTSTGYEKINKKPEFETKPGIYKEKEIYVSIDTHGKTVHYTLDGSLPTTASPVYKDSIKLTATTVIKAITTDSARLVSPMATATYLINEKHTLPVVSVTMDEKDLYDENTGIYAMGHGAAAEKPYRGANFWMPWEKRAHVEFFDGKEGFSHDCGIKIFGAYSRARPKKSFQIKFRDRYDNASLDYDLYDRGKTDHVKSFVLRSGSQDDKGVMVRDEFFTTLMAEHSPTLHVQAHRAVVMYLNGKFFGVYYIREKINEEFVANHLNVPDKSVTLLVATGAVEYGSNEEYRKLEQYASSHDMRDPEAYKYMASQIDFNSLIDYKIGEYYSGNCDVGNIRYFKSSDPSCNNKWHWLFYDLDWAFYYYTPPHFYLSENATRASGPIKPYNLFVGKLLHNPQFRQLFFERWAYHYKNTISPDNALKVFDRMINRIKPEMQRNCEQWPQMTYKHWEDNIEKFRAKIKERPAKLQEELIREMNVTEAERQKYFK